MRNALKIRIAAITATLLLALAPVARAGITLDFTHDSFFAGNATAAAALQAAVDDLNAVLNFSGTALAPGNSSSAGTYQSNFTSGSTNVFTSGGTGVSYTNPSNGMSVAASQINLAAGEIKVFVGVRNLAGTTLGQGGPGGAVFGCCGTGGGFPADWTAGVAGAAALANTSLSRGDGPTMFNFSGTAGPFGGEVGTYDVDFGPTVGNLWFDVDGDNDGSQDSAAELDDYWHFDHTTDVVAGKNDFYSVALHEVLHAVGYGGSDSWEDNVSGNDWIGANAIAANGGSGVGLIDDDGAHIEHGIMSTTLIDGTMQEAVMDPNITTGTRKYLTQLDLAILQDIGFSNATAVPEPSALVALCLLGLASIRRRRRR